MRPHVTKSLKCSFMFRDRLRFQWRVPVWSRVKVRVRSQEAPGAEPRAEQLSPGRIELRAQRKVPFRIRLCRGYTRPLAPDRGGLRNPLGQPQLGLGNDMVSFQIPC